MERKDVPKLVFALLLPLVIGALGSLITINEISTWYSSLIKPEFNPPNWLFGPVWTTLYLLMGVAFFLAWRQPGDHRMAFVSFGTQLVLNLAWSYIFFGAHLLLWAFVEILILLAAIVWMMMTFARSSALSAWLLLPYLMWVLFATILTASIYYLNN